MRRKKYSQHLELTVKETCPKECAKLLGSRIENETDRPVGWTRAASLASYTGMLLATTLVTPPSIVRFSRRCTPVVRTVRRPVCTSFETPDNVIGGRRGDHNPLVYFTQLLNEFSRTRFRRSRVPHLKVRAAAVD